jgi:NADH:ubiquinone oxidoreductase subunit 4 (subunit M)
MNYVVLGLFVTNLLGLTGSVFLMIAHGIVSAGLFFMVGFLYDRYKTRVVRYYSGLVTFMPIYALFFFIFTLANMSFPGTCNFIGEALILFGVIQNNVFACWLAAVGIVFCAVYSIWLFNRIMYGPVSASLINFSDLSYKEFVTLLPLVILTLVLGIFPNYILGQLDDFAYTLIEFYN